MYMKKLSKMTLTQLTSLYTIVSEICRDYSRMTDGYVLATGDNVLDPLAAIPQEFRNTIEERQHYYSIRDRVMQEIKKKLLTEVDYE